MLQRRHKLISYIFSLFFNLKSAEPPPPPAPITRCFWPQVEGTGWPASPCKGERKPWLHRSRDLYICSIETIAFSLSWTPCFENRRITTRPLWFSAFWTLQDQLTNRFVGVLMYLDGFRRQTFCAKTKLIPSSNVVDLDPYVFGIYGSGSVIICALISTFLWILFDFSSLKTDVNAPTKSNKQKMSFLLESCKPLRNKQDPKVSGTDPRIRIHKMSRSATLRCRTGNFWQLKVHHRCQLTLVANRKIFNQKSFKYFVWKPCDTVPLTHASIVSRGLRNACRICFIYSQIADWCRSKWMNKSVNHTSNHFDQIIRFLLGVNRRFGFFTCHGIIQLK
jgi:hypothetical protein